MELGFLKFQQPQRLGFFVLDFRENIQGHFFDYHFRIGAIQSVVFRTVHRFWSAVKYSEKDSCCFAFPNIGLV
jgi:hypothetical protein